MPLGRQGCGWWRCRPTNPAVPETMPESHRRWPSLQAGTVDAITVHQRQNRNPHGAVAACSASGAGWQQRLVASLKVVSIGPQTSLSCREHFGRIDAEADPHDLEGLVNACCKAAELTDQLRQISSRGSPSCANCRQPRCTSMPSTDQVSGNIGRSSAAQRPSLHRCKARHCQRRTEPERGAADPPASRRSTSDRRRGRWLHRHQVHLPSPGAAPATAETDPGARPVPPHGPAAPTAEG